MSDRLNLVRDYVDSIITTISPTNELLAAKGHIYGVADCCVLLAMRRGLDPELASIIGLFHDIYRYKTMINDFHDHNGAEMVRVVLRRMSEYFSEEDTKTILSAIFHHSDKERIHKPYGELLKDADTLSPFIYEAGIVTVSKARKNRLDKIVQELQLSIGAVQLAEEPEVRELSNSGDRRQTLADISYKLASSSLEGSKSDAIYMDMIRYWPEDSSFAELKNGWCAAFVYHCCQKAGFTLPIRWVSLPARFASVSAWYAWAKGLDYFIEESDQIIPQPGDIVVYHFLISPEYKQKEHINTPTDHIGVVISCNGDTMVVAEGNVSNQNKAEIVTRPLHQSIMGYIRIDNSFDYSSWQFDYIADTVR